MFLEKWPESLPTEKCSKMLFKIKVFKEKVHRGDRRQTLYWSKCTFFFTLNMGFPAGYWTNLLSYISTSVALLFSRPTCWMWWGCCTLVVYLRTTPPRGSDRYGHRRWTTVCFLWWKQKKKHALKQTCVVFRFQILYSINGCIRNMKMVGGAVSAKSPTAGREL